MLCQNCKRNDATTHIRRVVGGETAEGHFCAECAAQLGYGDMFSGSFSLSSLLGSFLSDGQPASSGAIATVKRCPRCGSSFHDIVHSGTPGCSECYRTFYDRLIPLLQRIHGKTHHSGKIASEQESDSARVKLDSLRDALKGAIADERFEEAARLRDQIKTLESEGKRDE